jgi:tetratricopeptide (TPR) repeat protein
MLVPVIGLVQVGSQAMADRYTYLPLIGIFMGLAWTGAHWVARQPQLRAMCGASAVTSLAVCAWLSNVQASYWQTSTTLWEHDLAVTTDNAVAEYEVGVARVREHRYAEAVQHFENAIALKPDHADSHNNLGLLLVARGRVDEGIGHYREDQRAKLDTAELHFNLGAALAAQGKLEDAVSEYITSLRLKPQLLNSGIQLAMTLRLAAQTGKLQQIVQGLSHVLRLGPDAQVQYAMGLALAIQGDAQAANSQYRDALRLNPNWALALNELAWSLATNPKPELRDGKTAVQLAEQACVLTRYQETIFVGTLAAAYAEAGRFQQAVSTVQKAVALAGLKREGDLEKVNLHLLELYREGKVYHESN